MNHIKVNESDIDERGKAVIMKLVIKNNLKVMSQLNLVVCDKMLRVESMCGQIVELALKYIFNRYGHRIEPLPLNEYRD